MDVVVVMETDGETEEWNIKVSGNDKAEQTVVKLYSIRIFSIVCKAMMRYDIIYRSSICRTERGFSPAGCMTDKSCGIQEV